MDEEENEIEEEKRDIEIVSGDGSDLDISPVYDHIKVDKPDNNTDKKQDIVIPKSKNDNNSNNNNGNDEKNDNNDKD